MSMSFDLGGVTQLTRLLRDYPKKIQDSIIDSAVGAGATLIRKRAQQNIQANGSVRTGKLLRSLRTRKVRGTHGVYRIYTDSTAPHSHLVEYGTVKRVLAAPRPARIGNNIAWITHTGTMPAKPFFRPAIDENQREILEKIAVHLSKRMLAEATKMSRSYRTLSKSYKRRLVA